MDDDYDNEGYGDDGYDEEYEGVVFLGNIYEGRDGRVVVREILSECVGLVVDAKMSLIHKIGRRIDAHEHLWEPFARSLNLSEECIAQVQLMENGGGSSARLFLRRYLQQQQETVVCEFMDTLSSLDMRCYRP